MRRALRHGDRVRLGRQELCEVVAANPSVSKLHCRVEVDAEPDLKLNKPKVEEVGFYDGSEKMVKCYVTDLSSNGTWISRGSKYVETGREDKICSPFVADSFTSVFNRSSSVDGYSRAVKLVKGEMVEMSIGDTLYLLAPRHKDSSSCCFVLEADPSCPDGLFLTQHSPVEEKEGVGAAMSSKNDSVEKRKKEECDGYPGGSTAYVEGAMKRTMEEKGPEGSSVMVGMKRRKEGTVSMLVAKVGTISVDKRTGVGREEEGGGAERVRIGEDAVKSKGEGWEEGGGGAKRARLEEALSPGKASMGVDTTIYDLRKEERGEDGCATKDIEHSDTHEGRCPICDRIFPTAVLPEHSARCQVSSESEASTPDCIKSPSSSASSSLDHPPFPLKVEMSIEICPKCLLWFPVIELVTHWEVCTLSAPLPAPTSITHTSPSPITTVHSTSEHSTTATVHTTSVHSTTAHSPTAHCKTLHSTIIPTGDTHHAISTHTSEYPTSPTSDSDHNELCPSCKKLFPIETLVEHSEACFKSTGMEPAMASVPLTSEEEIFNDLTENDITGEGRVYDLEPHIPTAVDAGTELEQCSYCLEDFELTKLPSHALTCSKQEENSQCTIEEHCQHCLGLFPLSDLVMHSLNCSSRKHSTSVGARGVTGSQDECGEPLERCMHCFRDFPLSVLVNHSDMCTGDMLGSRERFKAFLPSIHDLDPMALAVLNDRQTRAVDYVIKKSRHDSERLYAVLKSKVERLGYNERDLEKVLLWVRHEAPIIIHLSLDKVLHLLLRDTHYRNQFETHTSGGCTDLRIRASWEDRIFNKLYDHSPPVERVKYGVLNIVGDPRGVRSCYGYGDSFIQLKKVRLRTTFASADTSFGGVKVSCCEHYGNVLVEYSDYELKAIIEVATRKKSFLHSSVISTYKEIQIHGPVCLSENVECIVVNNRHASDTSMGVMLEEFVKKNGCNLIWMELDDTHSHPTLEAPTPITSTVPSHLWDIEPSERMRERRRRRRRRRRREDYSF